MRERLADAEIARIGPAVTRKNGIRESSKETGLPFCHRKVQNGRPVFRGMNIPHSILFYSLRNKTANECTESFTETAEVLIMRS